MWEKDQQFEATDKWDFSCIHSKIWPDLHEYEYFRSKVWHDLSKYFARLIDNNGLVNMWWTSFNLQMVGQGWTHQMLAVRSGYSQRIKLYGPFRWGH